MEKGKLLTEPLVVPVADLVLLLLLLVAASGRFLFRKVKKLGRVKLVRGIHRGRGGGGVGVGRGIFIRCCCFAGAGAALRETIHCK